MTDQQNHPQPLGEVSEVELMTSDDLSATRHDKSDDPATLGSGAVTGHTEEANVPTTIGVYRQKSDTRIAAAAAATYRAPMTVSANTVIAAIEQERPGLSTTKRNLLMYFCQGHHLGHSDTPLFAEPLYATENGVAIDLDDTPVGDLNDSSLNTVGYVLSRYGNLSPADLRTLIQASTAWELGRKAIDEHRIEWVWLTDWFRRPDELEDADDDRPTASMVAAYIAQRQAAGTWPPERPI